jgi:hypothetical protein
MSNPRASWYPGVHLWRKKDDIVRGKVLNRANWTHSGPTVSYLIQLHFHSSNLQYTDSWRNQSSSTHTNSLQAQGFKRTHALINIRRLPRLNLYQPTVLAEHQISWPAKANLLSASLAQLPHTPIRYAHPTVEFLFLRQIAWHWPEPIWLCRLFVRLFLSQPGNFIPQSP